MDPVETKTAWIRVKNKTEDKLKGINLTVAKKAVKDAFNVKYFDGSDNITQEVRTERAQLQARGRGGDEVQGADQDQGGGRSCASWPRSTIPPPATRTPSSPSTLIAEPAEGCPGSADV